MPRCVTVCVDCKEFYGNRFENILVRILTEITISYQNIGLFKLHRLDFRSY